MAAQKDMIQAGLFVNQAAAISGFPQTGITALAGGANSASTPLLTFGPNLVTVCASANDSVKIPTGGRKGDEIFVKSTAATNAVAVFPPTGGTINGASTDALFSITAVKAAVLKCMTDDGLTWVALLGA